MGKSNTKTQLFADMERDWRALHAHLARLTVQQMTSVHDPEGWAVKDHLAHLAAWEESILVLFQDKPRHQGLGVAEELYASGSFDAVNAAIYEQRKDLSLDQVLSRLQSTHDQLLALVRPLSDDELNRPASSYFRNLSPAERRRLADLVRENTAEHYAEHLEWIEALVPGEIS
jgi:hypothetical protein